MIDPKILFVKQFLATLAQKNITTIPINNAEFNQGMHKMAEYFFHNRDHFGPFVDNLDFLFLKYSTNGEYRQFSKIIEGFNGRVVSLENPHYIKANIRLQDTYTNELISNSELHIQNKQYQELVTCFQQGANIS